MQSCTLMNGVYRRAADSPNPPTCSRRDMMFPRIQIITRFFFSPQRPAGSAHSICTLLIHEACLLYITKSLLTTFLNTLSCALCDQTGFLISPFWINAMIRLLLFVVVNCDSALRYPLYYTVMHN